MCRVDNLIPTLKVLSSQKNNKNQQQQQIKSKSTQTFFPLIFGPRDDSISNEFQPAAITRVELSQASQQPFELT